ncbi:MAG: HXXEE domain-containing protein [Sporomusaceae bacterium]|jgi:hypothetical protein|nr:HXXEE domain-containing protein [Sporomusaceae bacterium]
MKLFQIIIWLFPIMFMIHDFEEIIMLKAYQKRNAAYIQTLRKKGKYIPFGFESTTPVFSIAVAIQFIMFSVISLLSVVFASYYVWYLFFLGYTAHFIFHIIIWLRFKKYVPATITAILFLPINCYFVYKVSIMLGYSLLVLLLSIVFSSVVTAAWIYIAHKLMKTFGAWLAKYETANQPMT